jgi:hypothetical protein
MSSLAPATKLRDGGIATTTGTARAAKAAMLANISFKTMQSPKFHARLPFYRMEGVTVRFMKPSAF